MPKESNVGYSETTLEKQRDFIKIFRMLCSMWKGVTKRYYTSSDVLYFDLNGGHGIGTEEYAIVGSAVLSAAILKEVGLSHFAYICEVDKVNVSRLNDALLAYKNFKVIKGDNRIALNMFLPKSGNHHGLVYIDPNGYPISEFNFLSDFGQYEGCNKLDVLVSLSATTAKRTDNAHSDKHNLMKYLEKANKNKWYIRKLMKGKNKWSFLFGTNWEGFPDTFTDFHTFSSDEGQDILTFFCDKNGKVNNFRPGRPSQLSMLNGVN